MSHVVFLLVPGVHLLDLAGPAQVFSTAAGFGHPYTLSYVAEQPQVTTAQGLPLVAGLDWPELGPGDLIVVPGWRAVTLADAPALGSATLKVLRDHHAGGGTVASVCAGAEALGQAGLLDGRRCTTHHDVQDELALRHPGAVVVRDVLFTADDRVITSAGIASGIDLRSQTRPPPLTGASAEYLEAETGNGVTRLSRPSNSTMTVDPSPVPPPSGTSIGSRPPAAGRPSGESAKGEGVAEESGTR
ncbi:hypothetical protein SMICM304S_09060 [Streptomyces microflavus]